MAEISHLCEWYKLLFRGGVCGNIKYMSISLTRRNMTLKRARNLKSMELPALLRATLLICFRGMTRYHFDLLLGSSTMQPAHFHAPCMESCLSEIIFVKSGCVHYLVEEALVGLHVMIQWFHSPLLNRNNSKDSRWLWESVRKVFQLSPPLVWGWKCNQLRSAKRFARLSFTDRKSSIVKLDCMTSMNMQTCDHDVIVAFWSWLVALCFEESPVTWHDLYWGQRRGGCIWSCFVVVSKTSRTKKGTRRCLWPLEKWK